MKHICYTFLILFFFQETFALKKFTSIATLDYNLYVGWLQASSSEVEKSLILQIDTKNNDIKKILPPKKIETYEVLAVIPQQGNILVLFQNTVGGGHLPELYNFNFSSEKWIKVSTIPCLSPNRIKLNRLFINGKCGISEFKKSIKSHTDLVQASTKIDFPQRDTRNEILTVSPDFKMHKWETLHVNFNKKRNSQIYEANQFN